MNESHLNPTSMLNDSPNPLILAIKAILLHTVGVQALETSELRGPKAQKVRLCRGGAGVQGLGCRHAIF